MRALSEKRRMRNRNICVNGIGAAIALAAVSASGQSWNVGAGDWATGGNWNPATGTGGPTGVTHIRNGGTATISGAVNNPSHLAVGRDGVGTMTHNGGGTITTAWLQAGWGYGQTSTGTINIPVEQSTRPPAGINSVPHDQETPTTPSVLLPIRILPAS